MIDRFDVEPIPPRCGLHECVKGSAVALGTAWKKCIFCAYYTKDLDSAKCAPCLKSEELDGFRMDRFVAEKPEKYGIPKDWREEGETDD